MSSVPFNVSFLCTGNSARSISAEGSLRGSGGERFRAYSAGSAPKGEVHPLALATLQTYALPTDGYRSKPWDEFAGPGAPAMDFIITVCDNAAGEACPVWPGHPATAHWGVPDPAAETGDEARRSKAFHDAARTLKRRIESFSSSPSDKLDASSSSAESRGIGASRE
ncbi:hypothetical protein OY671_008825 [Metschnikowia pulcherrima]|nr:hypothetical protein OY671_008825 [Metschnikowia pulcherrima]